MQTLSCPIQSGCSITVPQISAMTTLYRITDARTSLVVFKACAVVVQVAVPSISISLHLLCNDTILQRKRIKVAAYSAGKEKHSPQGFDTTTHEVFPQ